MEMDMCDAGDMCCSQMELDQRLSERYWIGRDSGTLNLDQFIIRDIAVP